MTYFEQLADAFIISIIAGFISGYVVAGKKVLGMLIWGFFVYLLYVSIVYGYDLFGRTLQILVVILCLEVLVLGKLVSKYYEKQKN